MAVIRQLHSHYNFRKSIRSNSVVVERFFASIGRFRNFHDAFEIRISRFSLSSSCDHNSLFRTWPTGVAVPVTYGRRASDNAPFRWRVQILSDQLFCVKTSCRSHKPHLCVVRNYFKWSVPVPVALQTIRRTSAESFLVRESATGSHG